MGLPALDFQGCPGLQKSTRRSTSRPGSGLEAWADRCTPHSPLLPWVPAEHEATGRPSRVPSLSGSGQSLIPQGSPPL